jgi:hypothetical protein
MRASRRNIVTAPATMGRFRRNDRKSMHMLGRHGCFLSRTSKLGQRLVKTVKNDDQQATIEF